MKSFLIIGMGNFGHHLLKELSQYKCEIMIADIDEEKMSDVLNSVVSAKIADCTNVEVLRSFDIPSFDACFVCIGGNFQNSLEITSQLKELGARKVISKADEDLQAKFLLRNGADQVIYPERDAAANVAVSESSDSIFDSIRLADGYGIYEIVPNSKWIGQTIKGANIRSNYGLSILAIKRGEKISPLPNGDYVFCYEDHLMVLGKEEDVMKVIEK